MPKTTLFNTFAIEDLALRDYFAAKAMVAYLEATIGQMIDCKNVAENAYMMADAMIEVRKQHG